MTADFVDKVVGIILEIPGLLLVFASSPVSETIKEVYKGGEHAVTY